MPVTMRMTLARKPVSSPALVHSKIVQGIMSGVINEVIQAHEDIVDPWELEEDKPAFTAEVEELPSGTILKVLMTAESAEQATLSVWQLLNREEGTEVRPMHVSPDWQSKTAPRSLVSGSGAGHTIGIFPPWAEGIEGREFDKAVAEHLEPVADQAVRWSAEAALDAEFAG